MKAIAVTLTVLALLAGCARHRTTEPSASPAHTTKSECENAGGVWRATTGTCELRR
jgi:hypothetical protein